MFINEKCVFERILFISMNYDRVWAEIDMDAISFNLESIKKNISDNTKIIAVIKTDGYGHGAVPIAKLLETEDKVWGYAVATSEEALMLRQENIKKDILILGYTFACSYDELIKNNICNTVFTIEMAQELSETALKLNMTCKVHIKVDTGMARIGIQPDEEGMDIVKKISQLPGLKIEGIFTHFSSADESDKTKTYIQLEKFNDFVEKAETAIGIKIPLKHCSNSAGIAEFPEANMNAVRAGIILYGLWPSNEVKNSGKISLKPALSLKSRVVYIKTVPQNQEISYGGTFVTSRETRVATICIGYGDGYPRSLSNIGYVLINGHKAPMLGRICMDQFMVDVTDIEGEINVGTVVTLIGSDKEENISMEYLGELSGRFNYELACDLGKRIPRIYSMKKP